MNGVRQYFRHYHTGHPSRAMANGWKRTEQPGSARDKVAAQAKPEWLARSREATPSITTTSLSPINLASFAASRRQRSPRPAHGERLSHAPPFRGHHSTSACALRAECKRCVTTRLRSARRTGGRLERISLERWESWLTRGTGPFRALVWGLHYSTMDRSRVDLTCPGAACTGLHPPETDPG